MTTRPLTTREAIRKIQESGRPGRAYRVQLLARPIIESAAHADGGIRVLVLCEGKGASGFYKAEFVKSMLGILPGTDAYLDHEGQAELRDRPERSVRDKAGYYGAGELGAFTDPKNPQLGPRAAAFSTFYPRVDDPEVASLMATTIEKARRFPNAEPFVGWSINGWGAGAPGPSPDDGSPTELFEVCTLLTSIDLVTQAGRLGRAIVPGTGGVQESGFRPTFLRGVSAPHVAAREAHSASRSAGGFTPHFLR